MNKNVHSYVGSTEGIIDWDSVIATIAGASNGDNNSVMIADGDVPVREGRPFTFFTNDSAPEDDEDLGDCFYDLIGIWRKANYRIQDIIWMDYYPGEHFDIEIQNQFAKIVNAEPLRVFVSVVQPGVTVPYHWDLEDKEREWKDLNLVRYVCFMQEQQPGHFLMLDEHCFYNEKKHSIYQWKDRRNWHAAANSGFETYYLFHFLGYKK